MDELIVFVNIGWMVSYRGGADDPTLGGHGYLKSHTLGHEAWTFLPTGGRVYGYVPGSSNINLKRLGASSSAPSVDAVTVVWIAKSPRDKKTYVVGWYRDATVFRADNIRLIARAEEGDVAYQISAPHKRAKLLPPDQRTLRVPTAKGEGNLGQHPVWYGNPEFVQRVRAYLMNDGVEPSKPGPQPTRMPRQPDPELRKKIELAAVRHAADHYRSAEGGARTVESVERDNEGWDLNVIGADGVLRVEVKGLSGTILCVELTPNEYKQMRSAAHRVQYVVYVVTEALTNPVAHVFYYNAEASKGGSHVWSTHDGRALAIEALIGARLTADAIS